MFGLNQLFGGIMTQLEYLVAGAVTLLIFAFVARLGIYYGIKVFASRLSATVLSYGAVGVIGMLLFPILRPITTGIGYVVLTGSLPSFGIMASISNDYASAVNWLFGSGIWILAVVVLGLIVYVKWEQIDLAIWMWRHGND